jgi:hypothetical protein
MKNTQSREEQANKHQVADSRPPYETPVVMSLGGLTVGIGQACSHPGSGANRNCVPGSIADGQQCNMGTAAVADKCNTGPTAANDCNPGSTAGIGCVSGDGAGGSA